jgi:hypothetical protein
LGSSGIFTWFLLYFILMAQLQSAKICEQKYRKDYIEEEGNESLQKAGSVRTT